MKLRGFTLIELLVVLAIIATLLTLVSPNYFRNLDKSKEVVLKQNLTQTRDAIDKFHADRDRYPSTLMELVTERYLRQLPVDPIMDRNDSWILISAKDGKSGIYDIQSGAAGKGQDGTLFQSW